MPIREATGRDLDSIIAMIRGLAEYEREPGAVTLDPAELRDYLFGPHPYAEVLIAETDAGEAAGFALFFHNFSTWLGKPGMWIEDLFVWPQHRGRGHGRALLAEVARIACARGCGRLEWSVLDWNAPSIAFYESFGAKAMDEWTTYRVAGSALQALADGTP